MCLLVIIHGFLLRGDWKETMLLTRLDEVDSESSQTLLDSDMERNEHLRKRVGIFVSPLGPIQDSIEMTSKETRYRFT